VIYGFPFHLEPGQKIIFRVTYQLLAELGLTATANFKKADLASAIVPPENKGNAKTPNLSGYLTIMLLSKSLWLVFLQALVKCKDSVLS
jgi:hypothetical protein